MNILDLLKNGKSAIDGIPPRYELEKGIKISKQRINKILRTQERPSIIQIAGGSASGKTSKVTKIIEEYYKEILIKISMDDYYYGKTYMNKEAAKGRILNWDQPEAIDIPQLQEHIESLKSGIPIKKPIYSMKTSESCTKEDIYPARVILLEGLFSLTEGLYEKGDFNIFVYADGVTRLRRRIMRDQQRTGQNIGEITSYFKETVEPMHQKYI